MFLNLSLTKRYLGYFHPFVIINKFIASKLVYKSFFMYAVLSLG